MLTNRDPAHWLKKLTTTNTPKRLLWLDCAGHSQLEQGLYVERWSSGALGTTHYTSRLGERKDTMNVYDTPAELWQAADAFCLIRRRTVLFAYDLASQLRVSQGLLALTRMGWSVDKIVLERTSGWARFVQGERTLMCCDLRSWAPVDFGKFAADIEYQDPDRPTRPKWSPDLTAVPAWRAGIIRDATLQILSWIEAENLGPFRPTGSGQSYSAFRRRFLTDNLLVHDDVERLAAERAAMHTGRCEAWQHGQLTDGPFIEFDLHAAYCTIARDCAVPAVATGEMSHPTAERVKDAMLLNAVLALVTVTTDVPCVPVKLGGRTVWPVGTFQTWLWDPELELAFTHAQNVTVHRAYKYMRKPALHAFAEWVLAGMGEQTTVYGLVPQRVLKHWSRCLVGRLGLRYRSWVRFGTSPDPDLRLVTYIDIDEGTSTDMLCAGYDRFILAEMCEALDSLPQIPSWVMSECRRRLWDAMGFIGFDDVAYVDTDSMIVDVSKRGSYMFMAQTLHAAGWIEKGTYATVTINGPRNIVAESARRVAGLPLTARQTAPLEFTGQVMRSLKESMRAGELDCVASIPRKFVLDAPDLRRDHLPDHKTAPIRVQLPVQED